MTKKPKIINGVHELHGAIQDILLEAGYRSAPLYYDTTGKENRFDGMMNGDEPRPRDPADTVNITQDGSGTKWDVKWFAHRLQSGGGATIKMNTRPHTHQQTPALLDHPYMVSKGINEALPGLSVRFHPFFREYCIRVPATDLITGKVESYQYIPATPGLGKRNRKGPSIKGLVYICGPLGSWQGQPVVYIAEGMATAYSIFKATGAPCLACFGCGFFEAATENLQKVYSGQIIWALDIPKKSQEIDKYEQLTLAAPKYGVSHTTPTLENGTDFNDLHMGQGLEVVKLQLQCLNKHITPDIVPDSDGGICKLLRELGLDKEIYKSLWWVASGEKGGRIINVLDGSTVKDGRAALRDQLVEDDRAVWDIETDWELPNGTARWAPQGRMLNFAPAPPPLKAPAWRDVQEYGPDARAKAAELCGFLERIFQGDIHRVMMYLKHLVEYPTKALPFAVILYGPKGIGKSCLLQLARLIVGVSNISEGSTLDQMLRRFGTSIYHKSYLNILHELDLNKIRNNGDTKLKQIITERMADLEFKGRDPIRGVRVNCNFLWATNETLQVGEYKEDRRYVWIGTRNRPLPKREYEIVADGILDTRKTKGNSFDWAPIKAFIDIYLMPLTYNVDVINDIQHDAALSTTDPILDFWRSIDKTQLENGQWHDLNDLARYANDYDGDHMGALYDSFGRPTGEKAKFTTALKRVINREGIYVIKEGRRMQGSNLIKPIGVGLSTTPNNASRYSDCISFTSEDAALNCQEDMLLARDWSKEEKDEAPPADPTPTNVTVHSSQDRPVTPIVHMYIEQAIQALDAAGINPSCESVWSHIVALKPHASIVAGDTYAYPYIRRMIHAHSHKKKNSKIDSSSGVGCSNVENDDGG